MAVCLAMAEALVAGPATVSVGFVVDKVVLRQVFTQVPLFFFPVGVITLLLIRSSITDDVFTV